jgi:hypothetical protein
MNDLSRWRSIYANTPSVRDVSKEEGWDILAKDPTSPVRYVNCTEHISSASDWVGKNLFLTPLPLTTRTPSMFLRQAVNKDAQKSIRKSKTDSLNCFVNLQYFKKVKYRDPVIIVEGVKDAEAVRIAGNYPFVIAVMTSSIKEVFAQFLKYLTRKAIFLFDADEAGERGTRFSCFKCKKQGLPFESISLPSGVNDVGEILAEKVKYQKWLEQTIKIKVLK